MRTPLQDVRSPELAEAPVSRLLIHRSPELGEPPVSHRRLSIGLQIGAHLADLGSQHAGEVVLQALAALAFFQPDRKFEFSVPSQGAEMGRRFVLDRCTNPGTYELDLEMLNM